jgi:hypothetical protein
MVPYSTQWLMTDRYGRLLPDFEAIKAFSNSPDMDLITHDQRKEVYETLASFTP